MLEELGDIIRFHRKKSGLTQLELAQLAGIGKAAVYDMEHTTKSTRIDTLLKVLKVLNIEVRLESPIMKAYEDHKHEESESVRSQK
jgi:transcriptional regulator with XRE-family HTH domain